MKYRVFLSFFIGIIVFHHHTYAQLVGDNAFMLGRWLEVGIAPNGSWGNTMPVPAGYTTRTGSALSYVDPITGTTATGNGLDFSYDQGHDGWAVGSPAWYGAFFLPGTPFDGWQIQMEDTMSSAFYSSGRFDTTLGGTFGGTVDGYSFVPATCGNPQSYFEGIWDGYAGLHRAGWHNALRIRQVNHLDTNASWLNVTTTFVNTTNDTIHGIYYQATADPDNDETTPGGSFPTNNHIAYQGDALNRHEVWARPPSAHQDAFSGLATMDCRAQVLIYQSWPPPMVTGNNLDRVWAHTTTSMGTCYYPLGSTTLSQDIAYAVIFNVGDLPPHDSTFVSYAWIFSDTTAIDSSVATVPSLITEGKNHLAGIPDTVGQCDMSGCGVDSAGHFFTADILNGDVNYWTYSNWTWSPSRGLSTTRGIHVTVDFDSIAGPTTYTITGVQSSAFGRCPTAAPVTFLLYVVPCLSASSNSPGPVGSYAMMICVTDTLKLQAHGDSVGATFTWYGPGGYTATGQNPIRTGMSAADTGLYFVVRYNGTLHDTARTYVYLKNLPVVTATSNSPVCSGVGNAILFNATPDSSAFGETFSWSGPNGFFGSVINPIYPDPPTSASGLYKVVTSWRGCEDSAYIDVTVDSTPAVPRLATGTPQTCSGPGDTLFLFATDTTLGVTYGWSGPAGFTSMLQNPIIPGPPTSYGGVYTVTVSATYGTLTCSNTAAITAVVDSTPYTPTDSSNSPVCTGATLMLFANSTTGALYSWTGPNSFVSNLQNPTIGPATTSASGVYFVTAYQTYVVGTNTLTCTSAAATLLGIVDSTPAGPLASSNSPGFPGIAICEGDSLKLTSSDATSGVFFSWIGANGFTSTQQNPVIAPVSPAATGLYTVTASFGTACVASSVISVSITPTPPLTATSNSPVCSGDADSLFLQATSDPGATFYWTGPYVFRSSVQNPLRSPVLTEYAGVYHVTATVNNCSRTVDDTVVIHATPPPPRVTWLTYCQYFDAPQLQAMGDSVLWYPSAASVSGQLGGPKPPTDTVGQQTYFATQTLAGCTSAKDSMKITVVPKPRVHVTSDTGVCPHDTAILSATNLTSDQLYYHWFPPLYILSDTSQPSIAVLPANNYHYTLVATNQYGCTDTNGVTVSVFAGAVIDLGDSVRLYPGETYQITPQTNCTYFSWFPYEGLSNAYISNPVASPTVDTRYVVHALTSWGCAVDDSLNIYVSYESLLDVPNAFVPGNGPNNKFKILKRGIATLSDFSIFDRWGNKVFETTNIDDGWDGTFNSKPQPEGVYIYQIHATTSAGTPFVKQGNVTLLR